MIKGLATPNNIKFLSSFLNYHNKEDIAKEIFDLLNKTPDEIITHFVVKKDFDKARALIKTFFPKTKRDLGHRVEYYVLLCEQICDVLKQIGNDGGKDMSRKSLTDSMFCELHLLLDEMEKKDLFLMKMKLHRSCIELLEMRNICADNIVVDMIEYFGEREGIDNEEKCLEFSLNIPSALMKWKIETTEKNTEEDETPFIDIIDHAKSVLSKGKSLRDSERLSIFYDKEKESVIVKPNDDIAYHIAEGQNLPWKAAQSSPKNI